jgi:glucose-1-phosphate adenylyltransferase
MRVSGDERIKTLILAGGKGEGLSVLAAHRAVASMPFGGRYRLVDFPLSNCVNSGLYDIGILAQYNPISLMDHLGTGQAWDLDRKRTGVSLLQPIQTDARSSWYRGTADALRQNRRVFQEHDFVLVLPGDLIFKMDFRGLIRQHRRRRAAVTIATAVADFHDIHRFGVVEVADDDRVTAFLEKPDRPVGTVASMAIYLFDAAYLTHKLEPLRKGQYDLVRDVVVPAVAEGVVHQFPFNGYWEDVGELTPYYKANMELLRDSPRLEMTTPSWPIMTPTDEMPPAKFGPKSHVVRSLVANGSIVNGKVINSILSRGVYVEEGALVRDSILFGDTVVRGGAVVDRAIIDRVCDVGENARVGAGEVPGGNERFGGLFSGGVTVVGKGVALPAGVAVGRHVCVAPYTPVELFGEEVPAGAAVGDFNSP